MFHESHAATADMSVLPSVLGCRTLRRTVQVRLRSHTLWLPGGTPIFTGSPTAIHETSGLESTSSLYFEYCILTWYTNSRNQFPSCSDKNLIDLIAFPGVPPRMDASCLYIEAIAELTSHLEMKMSSLHFESRFSGVQLLVVEEPSPWPVSLITFFGKLLDSFSY